ncbi:MAG TPA: NUDIX domain-containing protein [Allosphingosinicella sp.]|nr:NUDIX domain-containing protein [Allosphingosinicella sp.]
MKWLLDPLYRVQRRLWRILRPRTRGVKVMLFSEAGELLLVRNTYGRTDLFVLPGGGVRPFEAPEAAARREVKEELGCGVAALAFVSIHASTHEGKRDTVHLYRARPTGSVRADGFEVAEARFFALDALPPSVSPATLRRIEEHRGLRAASESW